ncbi:MAG: TolC family protein [Verrucomicrobiia bacterium]
MKTVRGLIAVILLIGFGALAQQTNEVQRQISLEECIEMALKHNLDIQIERLNPKIRQSILEASQAVYDPLISMGYSREHMESPGKYIDFFGSPLKVEGGHDNYDNLNLSVTGKLPFGTTYSVPIEYTRQYGSSFPWDQYGGSVGIQLRQPLLKDAAIDSERWTILVNKKNLKVSEFGLRYQMINVISAVRQAYYELVYARENVKVQEKGLELAERLYKDNVAKVKAGVLLPMDEKLAESEVATRRSDLINAWHLVTVQENMLKNMVVDDLDSWKDVRLVPAEPLIAIPQRFDLQESWRIGLASRPDLAQMKISVEIRDLDIRYYKNQKLPDVSLVGQYANSAINTGASGAFADSWTPRYPNYVYGVEVVFPWSNKQVKAKLRESKEMREQAELMVKKLEQDIMVQIQDAISLAKSSFERVDATRKARLYAEAALDAEEKKYQNGKSTSFFVLQYQRDLIAARLAEMRALVDYNKALTALAQAEGTILDRLNIKIDFE